MAVRITPISQGVTMKKQINANAPWEKEHPDQPKFQHQRSGGAGDVKPMREVLDIPADPGGQWAVLVVLVHGGESCATARSPLTSFTMPDSK